MSRASALQLAQRKRDLGLARLRQITLLAAVGGVVGTVGLGYLAANTAPGHNQVGIYPAVGATQGSNLPGTSQGNGFLAPAQLPQVGLGGGVTVSGGS